MSPKTKKNFLGIGSFILGFGFMGAMDGIIFHQLLQWHSVVTDTTRPGQIASDGIFHFGVTVALVIGGILLWLAGRPSEVSRGVNRLVGGFLTGAGIFNLVEGLINHHLLKIHRVKPGDPNALFYDISFLALGLLLVIAGEAIRRKRPANGKVE
ncbi:MULTISPECIES: DUF2243 domain-containing protein [Bacillaceae]|jgi:uncharacterized membrane protein|uniref:DUF2243 domain-containing protein n=1 Tax=Bacillaceae TaxID=186817 RepID=UPI0011A99CA9|nr:MULTISPECIES: DUF2243 domain-containing protein [Bacillaceae]MCM3123633.1 DUF2243 domain-containing protein [Mesobacillus sp. MER 33]MCM3234352.1 DUF2243 domain-containing protein [Mesobacillus sp. MER 48]